ncbi:MAG: heme-copper oxidase subunit III [Deltaproteobacteria bacterium]|nr:heme-copper oxidase subunit III [Deltaproteobacteria bacterium]MCL4873896.1 heme-copper oxidase subunit III [bacterium]
MNGHAHEMKWHTSYWPLLVSVGILFLAPLAFGFYFVYKMPMAAFICLGIGAPLVLISIVGWVREGLEDEHGYSVGLSVWAMPFFIVAEAFLFVGFFAAYWVTRLTAPFWPPPGTPDISMAVPIVMTFILVASSFTIHLAEEKIEDEHYDRKGFIFWLVVTMVLGTVFLGISAFEWTELYHHGFTFGTNVFSSSFFSITGFHGSHVLVGLALFLCMLLPALSGKVNKAFVKSASIYWHFVDVVWFFVVSQLYFW